ncbi:MAG: apolipoprotein N-acyltransferase [Acidobacteriia bacterium]|nr:apolipoprotein N-acyltransferase [Terriglobia bacterium]
MGATLAVERANGVGHPRHVALGELGEHRQAQQALRDPLRDGEAAPLESEALVRLLEMQRQRIVLGPEGRVVEQYDKIHLVPFGEYVPAWAFPDKIGKITSQVGDFVPGTTYRVARTPEGTIAVFICYEDIFPQLVRRLASQGAGVLVNISNDAWYDDTAAAPQHLEMARLRAIENRRYLLRATDDGITAVIDPYGRVAAEAPRHRELVLSADFRYLTRQTFYTAHGDVFAWLCVAITGVLIVNAIVARRRSNAM